MNIVTPPLQGDPKEEEWIYGSFWRRPHVYIRPDDCLHDNAADKEDCRTCFRRYINSYFDPLPPEWVYDKCSGKDVNLIKEAENPAKDVHPRYGAICEVFITYPNLQLHTCCEFYTDTYTLKKPCTVVLGEGYGMLADLFDRVLMGMRPGDTICVHATIDETKCKEYWDWSREQRFFVSLRSFVNDTADDSVDILFELATQHLERGYDQVAAKQLGAALMSYKRALLLSGLPVEVFDRPLTYTMLTNLSPPLSADYKDVVVHTFLDMAKLWMRTDKKDYHKAVFYASQALAVLPETYHARWLRATAFTALMQYRSAFTDLSVLMSSSARYMLADLRSEHERVRQLYRYSNIKRMRAEESVGDDTRRKRMRIV